ncbi:unnamed protein product, partial [Closterium sp. Naga37s-1]
QGPRPEVNCCVASIIAVPLIPTSLCSPTPYIWARPISHGSDDCSRHAAARASDRPPSRCCHCCHQHDATWQRSLLACFSGRRFFLSWSDVAGGSADLPLGHPSKGHHLHGGRRARQKQLRCADLSKLMFLSVSRSHAPLMCVGADSPSRLSPLLSLHPLHFRCCCPYLFLSPISSLLPSFLPVLLPLTLS